MNKQNKELIQKLNEKDLLIQKKEDEKKVIEGMGIYIKYRQSKRTQQRNIGERKRTKCF
jgi:hypothetical protein